MVTDLFVDPDAFFERIGEEPGAAILWPIFVVLLTAVAAAAVVLPGYFAGQAAMEGSGPGGGAGAAFLLFPIATSFLGVLVGFLVYVGLVHAISTVAFGGDGPISETVAVTGWGYVPALFGAVLTLAVYVYVYQTATLPSDPMAMFQAIARIMERPIFLAAWLLGFAFLAWQVFLWVIGLTHVRDLTTREAAMTLAAPVIVDLIGRYLLRYVLVPGG